MRLLSLLVMCACMLFAAGDRFSGKWSSSQNEVGGTIDFQLSDPAEVSFTYQGEEVKTKVLSVKREGGKFEVRYLFDLSGNKLISTISGTASKDKVDGTYRTTTEDGTSEVDGGTFSATAK